MNVLSNGVFTGGGLGSEPLAIEKGGTGATTAAEARTNLGITPENIGALSSGDHMIPSYTSITSLGLNYTSDGTEDDFSATDAVANFLKVFQALPIKALLIFTVASTSNFAQAIKAKVSTDLNLTYNSYYDVFCERLGTNTMFIRIANQGGSVKNFEYHALFHRNSDAGNLSTFSMNNSVRIGTSALTAGTTALANRAIYLQYE